MKWIAISGSWRKTNDEIERLVRETVRGIITAGNGILSGGALNVDYFAINEALKHNPAADRIRIFIPSAFHTYAEHYRRSAERGLVTRQQVETLLALLEDVKQRNLTTLVEKADNTAVERDLYFQQNTDIINAADGLIAFHVLTDESRGAGTLDAVEKARAKGLPVTVHTFDLRSEEGKAKPHQDGEPLTYV